MPFSIDRPARGVVALMRDEWHGVGRNTDSVCIGQDTPCATADATQMTTGTDSVDDHWSVYAETFGRSATTSGANHITVQSIVTGQATRQAAVVLVVP